MLKIAKEVLIEVDILCDVTEKNFSGYSKGAQRICALLFIQIHGLVKAIILLCENNLVSEARILTRSLTDVSAYLMFISDDDPEERVNFYRHSVALSEKIAIDDFNSSLEEDEPKAKVEFFNQIEKDALEYFRAKHGQDKTVSDIRKKYTLKHKDATYQLKDNDVRRTFASLYTQFYRPASALVHGQAPLNFAVKDGEDLKIGVRLPNQQIRICLQSACILTFHSARNLNKLLGMNRDDVIERMQQKISDLMELVKKGHLAEFRSAENPATHF